jgi:hypothetical protein
MKDVADYFARANNSYRPTVESQSAGCGIVSKIRGKLLTSLSGLRKGEAFALFVFLVRRFHHPIQFPAGRSIFLHLPIPFVLLSGIQQSGQFRAFLGGKPIDRCLDLFYASHVPSVRINASSDKSAIASCNLQSILPKLPLTSLARRSLGEGG